MLGVITESYCGLHSHRFSEWVRSVCFLCSTDGGGIRWETTGKNGGTFLSWGRGFKDGYFSIYLIIYLYFMTNSHTSLTVNPGDEGSSQWCRACQEKTLGTCNPGGDLERVKLNRKVNWMLASTCVGCLYFYSINDNNLIISFPAL